MSASKLKLSSGIHIITVRPDSTREEIMLLLKTLASEWLGLPNIFGIVATELQDITIESKPDYQIWIEEILKELGNPKTEFDFKVGFAHAIAGGKIDKVVLEKLASLKTDNKFLKSLNITWLPSFVSQFLSDSNRNIYILG